MVKGRCLRHSSTRSSPFPSGSNQVREAGEAGEAGRALLRWRFPIDSQQNPERPGQVAKGKISWVGRRRSSLETQGTDTGLLVNSSHQAAAEQEMLFLGSSLTCTNRRTSIDAAGFISRTRDFDTGTTVKAVRVLFQQPTWMQQAPAHVLHKPISLPRSSAWITETSMGHPRPQSHSLCSPRSISHLLCTLSTVGVHRGPSAGCRL